MFSICKQTHPATGIEHAISCYFFNKAERSLITAGANILKVFRLVPDIEHNAHNMDKYTEFNPPPSKLECMCQFLLNGNIMSIQSVNLSNSTRDALLLGFTDAKLSIVEYDPEMHDLKTLSLHYFEEDDMKDGWTHHHHHVPLVRADPENRCAVMTVFGRKLVVLPFRRDTAIDDTDTDIKPQMNTSTQSFQNAKLNATNPGASAHSKPTPILASYMIVLKDFIDKIDNVIDIQFLYGYYEPTLLILYEPLKTFAGRVAVRSDTCAMAAISLNLQQRVHPIIWSMANLPFDCIKAVPVKKPLGGTLIFSVNALIYLNQSIPPYGVSVNNIADSSSNFPLKQQQGDLCISFDCAQATFVEDDTLVLSLKGGELYVLTLLADSMRYVRSFHFEKAAASVLTTCITLCENNFLFLGSRLGNSLLLRFTETSNEVITLDESQEPEMKRRKARQVNNNSGAVPSGDVMRDPEELEVYGTQKPDHLQITSYVFEVCDSLLNIGPCGNVSIGEPTFLSEEFSDQAPDHDLELVTTAGYGKNGALCVLQRTIRPQIVTTFSLPGCSNMWTVYGGDEDRHTYLILSQEDGTMVLQTGVEINEIDNTGFVTQLPTVFAGNLGHGRYIVQVTTGMVRLLQDITQIQNIPLDFGQPVVHVSCADPYIALMTIDGQVAIYGLREMRGGTAKLVLCKSTLSNNPPVTTLCLYRDVSGLFVNKIPDEFTHIPEHYITDAGRISSATCDTENEDDLLYGDEAGEFKMPSIVNIHLSKPKVYYNWWKKYLLDVRPTYWLFIVRENSNMEIYSVPEFKLSFYITNLCYGHRVLIDSLESVIDQNQSDSQTAANECNIQRQFAVRELQMVGLGARGTRPLLLVRLDSDLYVYEAYRFPRGNLKLRFRRIRHQIFYNALHETRIETNDTDFYAVQERIAKLRPFRNIAGYNGVFLAGTQPYWLFLTGRGEFRTHPMSVDGEVMSFTQFNNVNCPHGFLYFNRNGELRIGRLATHLSYDAVWPVRKVPLRCTPHFVTYHVESKTYCLVSSVGEPSKHYYRFNGEDKELTQEERGSRFPYPIQEMFSLMLFSPISWEIIPNTTVDLEEWEHVMCLKNVALAYEGTISGLKGYIAVGTNYNYGEDITSRGRILIYDIIEVVPEPGQPLTKNRFKEIYAKDQKGPVTALSQVKGFLVSAVGQKIYIWQLKDKDLVGVAFIDTQIYTHQINTIKSLILIADVYKSIALLRFQEEYRTLSLVSRDFRACEVYSCEFMIDNTSLGFLTSDSERNLVIYMYQPEARESLGGQRLLRKADFHLGQPVLSFFRCRCKLGELTQSSAVEEWGGERSKSTVGGGAERRHVTWFATLDGGLGYIMAIAEKTYRRFLMLQNVLVTHGAHIGGLNPKAFRTYNSWRRLNSNPARCVIDGDLVYSFTYLTVAEKLEIAKKIGTKLDELIDDLNDLQKITNHF